MHESTSCRRLPSREAQARLARERGRRVDEPLFPVEEMPLHLEAHVLAAEHLREAARLLARHAFPVAAQRLRDATLGPRGEHGDPARMLCEELERRGRFPLRPSDARLRQQPAEVAIAVAIAHEQDEARSVVERDRAADDRSHAGAPRRLVEADDPVQAVAIRQREGRMADGRGARDEILGMAGALEEGEVREGVKLDVGHVRSGLGWR
jgi:hypothetical protein